MAAGTGGEVARDAETQEVFSIGYRDEGRADVKLSAAVGTNDDLRGGAGFKKGGAADGVDREGAGEVSGVYGLVKLDRNHALVARRIAGVGVEARALGFDREGRRGKLEVALHQVGICREGGGEERE